MTNMKMFFIRGWMIQWEIFLGGEFKMVLLKVR
jgi:hypothetical protein